MTVLVCTRGRGELVGGCIRAIMAALRTDDELLVVEAGSRTARALVARVGDDRCRWIAAPQPGKSRQLNVGIAAARHEVILITDDDCLVAPDWVAAMAQPFLERDVGLAFGPTEGLSQLPGPPPDTPPPGPAPRAMWRFSHGAAMAVRREAAIEAGGFDERLGPGTPIHGEEADLMLRMQSLGWRCFVADAPPIRHIEWRTSGEEVRNLLVYERGGGAWVGAALRRGSSSAAAAILTRLRYQWDHLRSPDRFAVRAEIAFCSGLMAGLRLRPKRFLNAEDAQQVVSASKPGMTPRGTRPIERFPWPSLYGRRCLCLTSDDRIGRELDRRQAAQVTTLHPREVTVEDLETSELGRFDLVVAHDLTSMAEPSRWLHALAAICDSHLLSIERIDLWHTLLRRRRPSVIRRRGQRPRLVMNGAAHRRLLEGSDLRIQLVARPWIVREAGSAGYAERAMLTRPANVRTQDRRASIEAAADA